jgi:hypothetical protein
MRPSYVGTNLSWAEEVPGFAVGVVEAGAAVTEQQKVVTPRVASSGMMYQVSSGMM